MNDIIDILKAKSDHSLTTGAMYRKVLNTCKNLGVDTTGFEIDGFKGRGDKQQSRI